MCSCLIEHHIHYTANIYSFALMFYLSETRPYSGNISSGVINWMLDELIKYLNVHRALNSWIRNILACRVFVYVSESTIMLLCITSNKFTAVVILMVFIGSEHILDGRYVTNWNVDDLMYSIGVP
jgi:hypothetical protein